jgi:folate-binding protein YgfZ
VVDSHAEQLLRTQAVSLSLAGWTVLRLRGAQSRQYLQRFCTQDIEAAANGELTEAFVTNHKGRILAHLWIVPQGEELWLLSLPGNREVLKKHLQTYLLGWDAQLQDESDVSSCFCVAGPNSEVALQQMGLIPMATEAVAGDASLPEVVCCRWSALSLPGWLLWGASCALSAARERLQAAGVSEVSASVWDLLRIQSGIPQVGVDLSEDNLAQEAARTQRAISFRKGCYLGQEPIARLDAMGHTNRELRVVEVPGGLTLQAGVTVLANGKECGQLSSVAVSALQQTAWGMGLLRKAADLPDAVLEVQEHCGTKWAATSRIPQ